MIIVAETNRMIPTSIRDNLIIPNNAYVSASKSSYLELTDVSN